MKKYIIKRLFIMIPTILVIAIGMFCYFPVCFSSFLH